MRTLLMAGLAGLLFTLPVAAQQATPPAPPGGTAPRGPGAGPMGGPGMMGGQGMMGRAGPQEEDEDEDDRRGPMRGARHGHHHHRGAEAAPMQVIINIGPQNRVEIEERGPRGAGYGPMGERRMMGEAGRGRGMAERVEARLAALREELQLTQEQQPAWDRFAGTVREALGRMRPDPAAMGQAQGLEQRLSAHEARLNARLEAVRSVRGALSGLTGSLTEDQRRRLDEHATAVLPGMGGWQSGMR
ncbi:Spy/CpxP family protein refolding chaperone [Roseicella aerolata]|uniref:Spy/CpxP family protein refolding chaperone n=1 Tax=Roseicella aerolata TaxID=2883479 RepID=A0A9X1IFR0_9PROT|nr:Spy/CpxP family protein refolding chaperone [Roseicella aerolata]MCB4823800.1 Spy/CpxP family protein refolding chaperone [Roseicella aerolata]